MKRTGVAITAIVALALVLLPRCGQAAEDKVELRFRLEEGESYKLRVTIEQEIVQWIEGEEQEISQTIGIGETFTVKDVDDEGTMTVEVTFGPMAMKMEGPQGTFEYDSEDPPNDVPLLAQGLAAMVGSSFTMKLTPEGRVTDLKGVDKMFERIFESLDLPEGPIKDSIVESLKNQFGDEALKEMMGNIMTGLPDKPVGIGDSWSHTIVLTKGFPMIIKYTSTLTARKDGVATIKVESTIKSNPDAPPMKMGPMTMKYKFKGSQNGTFRLDEATGWFVEGEVKQEMSGEIIMTGIPGQTEEQSLPILIEGVIKLESK